MHVAVVGAGALGSVYGARIATRARDVRVSFVVRPSRVTDARPIVLERVDHPQDRITLSAPVRVAAVPGDADVVLLAVSVNDLDDALLAALRASEAAIVVLTPLLPDDFERMSRTFEKRLLPAMPSVAGYTNDAGVVRYWLPKVATTLIEEPRPLVAAVDTLVRAMHEAGIPTRFQIGTFGINAATTVTFLPLAFALDVAGSASALLGDRALLALALDGAREGRELGRMLGTPAPWAEMLTSFVGPTMLKIGVGLAERRSKEAVRYVEMHFGTKMHAQNVVMAEAIATLARTRGLPATALESLARRLRAMP
ncbi:MAG: 2-dehydropantoate 2-reductase N-terminal domain-containing protein [Polyangiaceae bacterium]